jgi:hypothetical protein
MPLNHGLVLASAFSTMVSMGVAASPIPPRAGLAVTTAPEPDGEPRLADGTEGRSKRVMREGLDGAMRNYVQAQYNGWMLDATEQPDRAARGVRKAFRAYRQAVAALDREYPEVVQPEP